MTTMMIATARDREEGNDDNDDGDNDNTAADDDVVKIKCCFLKVDRVFGVERCFYQHFTYVVAVIAPIHACLEFFETVPRTIFFFKPLVTFPHKHCQNNGQR